MIVRTQILVLSTLRYSDDQLIVNALSESEGRVTLMVHIRHTARAAVRYTLFQPLAWLEVEWEDNPRLTMRRPKSARPVITYATLHSDPLKASVVMFLAEFLLHVTRQEPDVSNIVSYTVYALRWFDGAERDFANFHIVYLLRLSLLLGIRPNVEEGPELPYFDMLAGAFTGRRPDHEHYLAGAEAAALSQLMRMNFPTMQMFRLSGAQRSAILERIIEYYRLHVPSMPELKSLEVLRAVFG